MSSYAERQFFLDITAEVATDAIDIRRFSLITAQVCVDGASPQGTLTLEGSNVPNNSRFWDTSPAAPPQTVTAAGLYTFEYVGAGFAFMRLHFVPNAGSVGKLSVYVIAKSEH